MMQRFEVWHDSILKLTGIRKKICLLFVGAFAALALPPIYFIPALIPSFVVFIWLLDGWVWESAGEKTTGFDWRFIWGSFLTGWFFGFGFFVAGLYWISLSLLVDADRWAWMMPISIIGLGGFLAIYTGLTSLLSCWLANPGPRRIMYISIFWVIFEWARSWMFTGFPWNLLGTVWAFNNEILQFASLSGVLGLSLLTTVIASSIAILGYSNRTKVYKIIFCCIPLACLTTVWFGGWYRLNDAKNLTVENVLLRLVQPNIPQKQKWIPKYRERHLKNLAELSSASPELFGKPMPTHIIWPETSIPYMLDGNTNLLKSIFTASSGLSHIRKIIPRDGALLVGSLRRTISDDRSVKLWNSLHAVAASGKIIDTFDKFHLVPFGEYIPFKTYLENLFLFGNLIKNRIDFSSGAGPVTMHVPGLPPVSPLICYEVIFSGKVVPSGLRHDVKPRWLLNITNDAWFGISSGPFQHLVTAQLRAVEEGLPLIRVANTGISAVIDSYGRILKSSALNERMYLDVKLPKQLDGKTYYSKYRQIGVLLVIVFLLVASRQSFFAK